VSQPLGFTLAMLATLCQAAIAQHSASSGPSERKISAKWIWLPGAAGPVYNQTIIARKNFQLDKPRHAVMRITADTYYRLKVNDQWVADGPCRSWPEHFQYDVLDLSNYLTDGANQLEVVARYYGVGDFHHVPKQAGLLAELEVTSGDGKTATVATDGSWDVAEAKAWVANTPKVFIQMEPFELYDARLADDLQFSKAREICDADAGPWKGLNPRDVALLTKQPVAFREFGGAKIVKCEGREFCLPAVRLMHPGLIEANGNVSAPCGMATILESKNGCKLNVQLDGMELAIDGRKVGNGATDIPAGEHLLLAFVQGITGHLKEKSARFLETENQDFQFANPLDAKAANPWCFIPLPKFSFVSDDLVWPTFFAAERPKEAALLGQYARQVGRYFAEVKSPGDFADKLAPEAKVLPLDKMFVQSGFWQFSNRRVVGDAAALVRNPTASMFDSANATVIEPSNRGDVELMYDLGEQNCGYYTFDMIAPAGTIVDIAEVEYIAPDGRVQFTDPYRNGMRYIAKEGVNRFTSLKRRSGRYLFLTLRHQHGPVEIRHFGLIESTYPVNGVGSFSCSDARLDEIWRISTRTLKLCMEDTFVDCPLYEQTLWVGDARNESLLAYPVFGSNDIAQRCIRITGQSLDRYPIAGCQTPSGWDVLLPAWSFLWGISTWDNYWYTGDEAFLRATYPDVIRNLQGAEKLVTPQGLFSGPFWNMFDWSGIDQDQRTVLHNSMFLVGAIDAALKEADALHDSTHTAWLKAFRQRLVDGINKLWDDKKKSYVDSVHADGTPSPSTCQHTNFLSILYDIVAPAHVADAKRNILEPPPGMVRIGSPFAGLYLYEALEKIGMEDRIIKEIYRNYLPMLEAGATTVWESFPSGTTGSNGFPTRSHCHAWSSAPSYFLNRIVLGVVPTAPGGKSVRISPHLCGLSWARGTVATVRGPISVSWRLKDEKTLDINYNAPAGTQVEFVKNSSLEGKDVHITAGRQ
jgi:alpha-L-rhamnosidase